MNEERSRARRRLGRLIILVGALVGSLVGFVVASSDPTYRSVGAYLVQASPATESDQVRATSALVATDEVIATYAGIARSETIATATRSILGDETARGIELVGEIRPGTNIIEVGARGGDPTRVEAMADAAVFSTNAYVEGLDDVFELVTLDEPGDARSLSSTPPVVGGMLGAVIAASLTWAGWTVFQRSRGENGPPRPHRIIDSGSGAFNRRYFVHRLREERARSRFEGRQFCVAVLHVDRVGSPDLVEPATLSNADLASLHSDLRETAAPHDVLAYLGDSRFAAILPYSNTVEARSMLGRWRSTTASRLRRRQYPGEVIVRGGVCECDALDCVGDPEAENLVGEMG